jgi:hypothetical protein
MENYFKDTKGPIEEYSWGKFIIRGEKHYKTTQENIGAGKDILLVGEIVSHWKERKGHQVKPQMLSRILDKQIEVVIIGNGAIGALDVPDNVIQFLEENGVKKVFIKCTPEACHLYNKLYHQGKNVVLFAHGTC